MQINGPLKRAQFEELASDPVGVELVVGRLWKTTSQNVFKVYDGTAVRQFADLNSAQTFSNKTLNEATFTQIATPANPSAGSSKLYPKTDGKFYTLDSAGNEAAVGSGSGGGVDNLIVNGSADDTASSIFVPYADAAGTRPVDGTGGAPTVTTAITTTNPLNKTKSFTLIKPASNCQGQGWAVPYSVPLAYKAKSLKLSTKFIVDSGTFVAGVNGSTPSDGDVIVYLYDITNSQLIEPSNIKLLSSSTTLSDVYEATFQTSATGTDYRLIYHVASTSALAYTLKVDDVTVSPQVYVYGTPTADLGSQQWLVTNASATSDFRVTRIGRRVYIDGQITLNGAATAQIGITIPSNYVADTANVYKELGTISQPVGHVRFLDVSLSAVYDTILQLASGSSLLTVSEQAGGTFVQPLGTGAASPFTWNAGDKILVKADWIVAGWQDSTRMSDQTDTREVTLESTTAGAQQTGINPNNSFVLLNYNTTRVDTHVSWVTNTYTIPVAGNYMVSGVVSINSTNVLNNRYLSGVFKNGVEIIRGTSITPPAGTFFGSPFSGVVNCVVGDQITIRLFGAGNNSVSTLQTDNSSVSIQRISGSSAIAASEKVYVEYSTSAGQAISTSPTIINYGTKIEDSHNAVTVGASWKFTAPRSDIYDIQAAFQLAAQASNAQKVLSVFKNGALYKNIHTDRNYSGGTDDQIGMGSTSVKLNQGDTLDIRGVCGTAGNLTAATTSNWVAIQSQRGI